MHTPTRCSHDEVDPHLPRSVVSQSPYLSVRHLNRTPGQWLVAAYSSIACEWVQAVGSIPWLETTLFTVCRSLRTLNTCPRWLLRSERAPASWPRWIFRTWIAFYCKPRLWWVPARPTRWYSWLLGCVSYGSWRWLHAEELLLHCWCLDCIYNDVLYSKCGTVRMLAKRHWKYCAELQPGRKMNIHWQRRTQGNHVSERSRLLYC